MKIRPISPIMFIRRLFTCNHIWEHYGGFSVCIKCNKVITYEKDENKDKKTDTYEG